MRLFDKIMRDGRVSAELKASLSEATVVSLDEVARYLFMESPQESWNFLTDFPNVAPPFEHAFYEARSTPYVLTNRNGKDMKMVWPNDRPREWALEVVAQEVDYDLVARSVYTLFPEEKAKGESLLKRIAEQNPKWSLINFMWMEGGALDYGLVPWWVWTYLVTPEGRFVTIPSDEHPTETVKEELALYGDKVALWIITGPTAYSPEKLKAWVQAKPSNAIDLSRMFTWVQYVQNFGVCMMHCKNTELRHTDPPAASVRKHRKRYGKALTTYKTLIIDPMKQVLTEARGSEVNNGLQVAFHKCRGHFKTYQQRGLFGKLKGMYWWKEQNRGDIASGRVIKDYKVEAKNEPAVDRPDRNSPGDRIIQRPGPLVVPVSLGTEEQKKGVD